MNRYEVIGMFTAMKALADKGDCESLRLIINETLAAAKGEKINENEEKGEKRAE